MNKLFTALSFVGLLGATAPAFADPFAAIQAFTLHDVNAAEAEYAANPTVATYDAATQCLGYLDTTLSAAPVGSSVLTLVPPQGVASTIADLDVALNTAHSGLSPIVIQFNAACGGYIEDLKAEAAATAASHFTVFGLRL